MQKVRNPKYPGNPGHNENVKFKKLVTPNFQEIQDTMRSIDESEDLQFKGPVNIFSKIIEEICP